MSCILFADDTNLFYNHKDLCQATSVINIELNKISVWFRANKLSLNASKTNYIIFHPHQKPAPKIDLFINNQVISSVRTTKFLGIVIDENLSWKPHIQKVASTISKSIGIIYKFKGLFSKQILLSLYNTLVLPYLNYCAIVWANAYPSIVNRLFILQKRAVRFINNAFYREHTTPLFNELRILNVFDLYKYQLGTFMYQYNKNQLPSNFSTFFTKINDIHTYNTRNKDNYYHNVSKSSLYQRTVRINGPTFWNSLDVRLRSQQSLKSFKTAFKNFLINANT